MLIQFIKFQKEEIKISEIKIKIMHNRGQVEETEYTRNKILMSIVAVEGEEAEVVIIIIIIIIGRGITTIQIHQEIIIGNITHKTIMKEEISKKNLITTNKKKIRTKMRQKAVNIPEEAATEEEVTKAQDIEEEVTLTIIIITKEMTATITAINIGTVILKSKGSLRLSSRRLSYKNKLSSKLSKKSKFMLQKTIQKLENVGPPIPLLY